MGLHVFQRVLPHPAATTEVTEADHLTTEVRALLHFARRTERVFQVRIHLDLNRKGERHCQTAHTRLTNGV